MFETLKQLLIDELRVNEADIKPEAELVNDLGINSLELADLILLCEEKFNVVIDDEDLNGFTTVKDVVDYLNEQAQIVGLNAKTLRELTGVQMWGHWFTHSQFTVIPEIHYQKLQKAYNKDGAFLLSHEELRGLICAEDGKKTVKPYFDITWFDDGEMPLTDVWRNSITSIKERENTGGHATPKPLKICERAIVSSSAVGSVVLDLFGGSGSTLVACEQLDRNCYMMELDPKYCDVIIKRWEIYTGEKAVLLNG